MQQYLLAAREMNALEHGKFGVWRGGDPLAWMLVFVPFVRMFEAMFIITFIAMGFFFPDIKRWTHEGRHHAPFDRLVAEVAAYQQNAQLHLHDDDEHPGFVRADCAAVAIGAERGGAAHGVTPPRIVAMGGGGFLMEPRNRRLDRWILSLARGRRVLFLPTASGDSEWAIARFYRAFRKHDCEASHLPLFNRRHADLRQVLLSQDVIYTGGGNTANMLAVWRVHGVDTLLREAWESGTVLCGVSAGAICWFESGLTDSFGPQLAPLRGALGFLPGSFCPHYDGEAERRPGFTRAIACSSLPPGYAADDGVGMLFEGTTLADVGASRRDVAAYRVDANGETPLTARRL